MPTSSADSPSWRKLALAAAAYAAAELALTLTVGRFFDWGRAEALLFFAFRPWLLLVAALLVARWGWRPRLVFYASALLLAGLDESLFLIGLGASDPWPEMLRGIAAGFVLLLAIDLALQIGLRYLGRRGSIAAGAAIGVLLVSPVSLRPYEAIALGDEKGEAAEPRPDLMLMTALPIIWGERGGFDPSSRPAAAYTALQREFAVRPLDTLNPVELERGRLLLLAQPRALAPAELVALDDWVRRGGRALILTDPALLWPSELLLGDIRRPPAIGLLAPLLSHWGLEVERPGADGMVVEDLTSGGRTRRLAMAAPGRFIGTTPGCGPAGRAYIADCRIGDGRALLIADADLMRDALWLPPGATSAERHNRIADNPLIVAEWLDALVGMRRPRVDAEVEWLSPTADRRLAPALGFAPILLFAGLAILWRPRRHS